MPAVAGCNPADDVPEVLERRTHRATRLTASGASVPPAAPNRPDSGMVGLLEAGVDVAMPAATGRPALALALSGARLRRSFAGEADSRSTSPLSYGSA